MRIRRWLKESRMQTKRNLEKMLPSTNTRKKRRIEAAIKLLDNEIAQIPHKSAGDLYSSLEDLAVAKPGVRGKCPSWKGDLYPLLYTPFNMAIHPDFTLFEYLVKQGGSQRHFCGDLVARDINELKIYCMSCVFDIVASICAVHKWDYQDIRRECLDIKKRFKK